MTYRKRWVFVSSLGTVLLLTIFSQQCEAHWLRDWLARRRLFRRQPVVYSPVTNCQPTTCRRTIMQYIPHVAYRINWSRTPVTVYRPVTTTDPYTCRPVVSYQPCTNYQWQAQRVPYITYQAAANVIPTSTTPTMYAGAPAVGCMGCAPATTVIPSQIGPTPVTPLPAPSSVIIQPQPGTGNSSTPQPTAPANQLPTSPDPANQPPALKVRRPWSLPYKLDPQLDSQGMNQGTSTSPYPSSYAEPTHTPTQDTGLRPIPNLDDEDYDEAPHLIDPRDHTASLGHIRLVAGISKVKSAESLTAPGSIVQQQSDLLVWDDSGWEAADPSMEKSGR